MIWVKPNAHPESAKDRPTLDHETVFLLSKNQNYYYDVDAVRGPNGRRLRTTWSIPTDPQKKAYTNGIYHPAVMPIELAHKFVANQVRLWLFVLAYNLGNFMRRLVLPEDMMHWTLTSLQTRLIKTGGRLVRHARRLVFQLAEVLVSREMLGGILERIGRLRLAPG